MKQLLCLALAGLLLAGCRKPDAIDCGPQPVVPTPSTTPPSATSNTSLAAFFAKYGAPLQRRGFVVGQSQAIRSAAGAVLTVSGVTFRDAANNPVQDSAYLYWREVYRVPAMVLSDMPTNSQAGQVLISGGEFELQVRKPGGQLLHVSPTVGSSTTLPLLQSLIPAEQDTTRQQLWQRPSSSAGWAQVPGGQPVQAVQQSQVQGPAYQVRLPLDSIRYVNIDQLWRAYQGASTVTVSVSVPTVSNSETRVWLRPLGFNGLYRATAGPTTSGGTATSYNASLPVGASLKAVVLQSVNGQLYFGTQTFTAQNGLTLTPTLTPVSEAGAVALIQTL